jgi:hypothetical protein
MRTVVPVCLLALASLSTPFNSAFAQDPAAAPKASPYVSVLGTIEKVDTAAKSITVKPPKADASTTVKFNEQTTFMKMPAGETDTKKATPATAADIAEGDSVIARVLTADPTGKPARTIYIEKQADLAQRREKTLEEWKTATSGTVTAVEPGVIKVTAKVAGSPTPKEITIDVSGRVEYTHYNPENGKYESGALADVKPGNQVRVLGEKNADSTHIKATDLGTGSFKTIGLQIKSIDTAGNSISGIETASKAPVTISLRADTSLKKFNDMSAMMVARQLNPTYQQPGGRGGRGGGAPGGGGAPAGAAPGAGGEAPAGGGMGRGGGRGRGGMDIGKIIEQQPAIQLSELKPGDAIIVTGATGKDAARLYAIALVAGVEPILRAAPNNGADPLAGSWNMGGGGGGDN